MKVFFYPHAYLRDRHLDTIRRWPMQSVVNPELASQREGRQVSREKAVQGKVSRSWKQRLPLMNIKRRPTKSPADSVIYVWGAVIDRGPFIVDLDNPYSLVAYNAAAMTLWRPVLRKILSSRRCLEIRCLSEACRKAVGELFGPAAYEKAMVVYPRLPQRTVGVESLSKTGPRFLFIGTQFEIKAGPELVEAFRLFRTRENQATLDVITHLPDAYSEFANVEGVRIHEAKFTREQIWANFMEQADVLIHPSYMESFGMVLLEALSHGLAIVASDVYAHREMVVHGRNGVLVNPPVKYWEGVLAGPLFRNQFRAQAYLRSVDRSSYVPALADAMEAVASDRDRLLQMRRASCELFRQRFLQEGNEP